MKILMHKNAMDVALLVDDDAQNVPGKLTGTWINLGYTGAPWPIGRASILVSPAQAPDWVDVTNKVTSVRKASGVP